MNTFETVDINTLSVTHVCDGEEVITGGSDGQVWVATFASALNANQFIRRVAQDGYAVYGERFKKVELIVKNPAAKIKQLRAVVQKGRLVVEDFMPNIGRCVLQKLRAAE